MPLHIAIYRLPNGAVDFEVASLLEVSQRLARRESVVRRDRGGEAQFLMSLSPGDMLQLPKDGAMKLRVVTSVWNGGQVVMRDHDDASGMTEFRPRAKTIVSDGGRKISVDPIGRVRPAND